MSRNSTVKKANIVTGRRKRAQVNYNEDDDGKLARRRAGRRARQGKNQGGDQESSMDDADSDEEAYKSPASDDHASDDEPMDVGVEDASSSSSSDGDDPSDSGDEADEPRRSLRNKSRLLATLPSHKRKKALQSLGIKKKKPAATKRKMAAAAKRTVRRVNGKDTSAVTSLRKVVRHDTKGMSMYQLARERLHVSAVPDSLPCRENEFEEISSYLESALLEGTGTCVYISGVPGTGKTATVLEVIRGLQHRSEEKELPVFDFVEINGMKLTDPTQAYSILWDCLSRDDKEAAKKRVTARHALDLLDQRFNRRDSETKTTIVLMDELDLLVTKNQSVMYNFFEWPNRPMSKLIVVAIANTMDLPERMLHNKISSRIGLTRINFQAYTHQQLYEIVESRLKGIDTFESDAMEFAARKVSAVSGDARRALDICRRAVELVEADKGSVTINVVNRAIKEMFSSPAVAFIQSCSLHQKLFLISVMQRIRQLGVGETEFGDIAQHHLQTCKWHHLEPPSTSDLMRVCESLGQARAILVEGGRFDLTMRVTLNFSEEDIIMACKPDRILGRLVS